MQKVDNFLIYQTIGRDAGWLAAASALAKETPSDPPHLIYVPERPMKRERFLEDVSSTIQSYGWASVVVGEGVVWEDGTPVSASSERDRFSNVEFGAMGGTSAAVRLHRILSDEFGFRGEFQIPESLHMCADDRVSDIDREEAESVGIEAVRAAVVGLSGRMINIRRSDDPAQASSYSVRYDSIPLSDVALHTKPLPKEYLTESFVSPAFIEYLSPLTGGFPEYHVFR
jgi:6-phosphofructokinase 1